MGFKVDMAGDDLYVNSLYVGNATPGNLTQTIGNSTGNVVSLTTATAAPTVAQTDTLFIFNRLAGTTVTLPAPTVGAKFTFVMGTVPTSNTDKVITDAASTFLTGGVYMDKALTITRYDADGTTIRSLNLNGTTTGGLSIGDQITFTCITATQWVVSGTVSGSGTLATPFATS